VGYPRNPIPASVTQDAFSRDRRVRRGKIFARDGQAERRPMSKQQMREESERLIREAMEKRNLVVKKGQTRIEAKCGKCGAPNRILVDPGQERVSYKCKECGHEQRTL
jgi:hypothetical protein